MTCEYVQFALRKLNLVTLYCKTNNFEKKTSIVDEDNSINQDKTSEKRSETAGY